MDDAVGSRSSRSGRRLPPEFGRGAPLSLLLLFSLYFVWAIFSLSCFMMCSWANLFLLWFHFYFYLAGFCCNDAVLTIFVFGICQWNSARSGKPFVWIVGRLVCICRYWFCCLLNGSLFHRVLKYMFTNSDEPLLLCAYWIFVKCVSIRRFYSISKQSKTERILLRKYYPLVAVLIFSPAVIFQVLYTSFLI